MYFLLPGTRLIQNQDNTYTLYNNKLLEEAKISRYAAKLLRKAYNINDFTIFQTNSNLKVFFDELVDIGFFTREESKGQQNDSTFLGKTHHMKFPLSALSIELTDACNLKCEHCYGAFCEQHTAKFVPFQWLKNNLLDLNDLSTKRIGLTGGESTLHPQFLEIAMFCLENGFELCVFTNGYNYSIIKELLENSSDYHYSIKVSLDGTESIHNLIRGNKKSFEKACQTMDEIKKYSNVELFISTSVLRKNAGNLSELDEFVRSHYPKATHTKDLAFPMGKANDCVFSISELESVAQNISGLFLDVTNISEPENRDIFLRKGNHLRCSGGCSQCTLMPDGFLKICTAACDSQFYFKYNAYEYGLKYAWNNCGSNIKKFRQERDKDTKDCRKCHYRTDCNRSDCRVLAWAYTGDANRSNPVVCFARNHEVRG